MSKNIFYFAIIYLILNSDIYPQSGWIEQTLSSNSLTALYFPINNDTGFIISSYESIFKTTDRGVSWNNIYTGSTFMGFSFFKNCLFGVFWGVLPRMTVNGGLNWNTMSIEIYSIGMGYTTGITFINNTTGFVIGGDAYPMPIPCCYDGVINKTTNAGQNWVEVYRHPGDQLQEIKFKDENNITVLDMRAFVKTTNGGNNWIYISEMFSDLFFFAKSMTDPFLDTIYVAGYISGDTAAVMKSTNRGISWFNSLQLPYQSRFRKIFFVNNKTGYAVGDTGLIVKTTNGGENWTVLNSGTSKKLNGVWFLNKDTGFVVGDSGLVLKTYTGGVITGIQNTISGISDKYYLSQNYPNPFNPSTKISYELRVTSYVSLKVFDLLGKEVAELVNQKQNAGSYEVEFDARIAVRQGSILPSGVYFYKLESSEFMDVKRMILIK